MGKVSFILPVFNCEKYIVSCVNNIIDSGIVEKEIILVDDGSVDHSGEICDSLATKYDFIKVIHQKNSGVSIARNKGIAVSSGDYIVFIDADDDIEMEKIAEVLIFMQKDDEIDMVIYGISFDYYHLGRLYRRDELCPAAKGKLNTDEWITELPALYRSNSLSPVWNKIIKRSVLVDNQLEFRKDMFLYEDLEFSLRCMSHCDVIYFWHEIVYHYRQSEDERNSGRRLKRIPHLYSLVEQIEDALETLIESKTEEKLQDEINEIIFSIYLILAREKIFVSNIADIKQICDDFRKWSGSRQVHPLKEQERFAGQLMNKAIYRLIVGRVYTAVRHKFAVAVKNTGIYQKLKG